MTRTGGENGVGGAHQLIEGEAFRRFIERVSDYAIYVIDPGGYIVTWNVGAERLKGYRADEVIGRHFSLFYTDEARAAGRPAEILRSAAERGSVEEVDWRVRKDGTRFWADVTIAAVREGEELLGYTKVTRDLTAARRAEEARLKLARAEEAVRLRDQFLSIASHELRTPLSTLQLQLASLVEKLKRIDGKLAARLD